MMKIVIIFYDYFLLFMEKSDKDVDKYIDYVVYLCQPEGVFILINIILGGF